MVDARQLDDNLFFVFGTPKSGTTWLQMLMDAHPSVCCRPEDQFQFFLHHVPLLLTEYNRVLSDIDRKTAKQGAMLFDNDDAEQVCRAIVSHALRKGFDDPRVLRCGAKDNGIVQTLAGFSKFFERARFIFIVRDPRDVAVSSWFHNVRVEKDFQERGGNLDHWTRTVVRGWVKSLQSVLRIGAELDDRFHVAQYEDLHQSPQETVAGLFRFLQVDDSASTTDACLEACAFTSFAKRQQGSEDRSSFFRKGVPGDWRTHLSQLLVEQVAQIGGQTMSRFGYGVR